MKKSFLASPALTLGLTFCAPIFFVFSQNWHMVDPLAILLSSGIVFLLGCLCTLCAFLVVKLGKKHFPNLPGWLQLLVMAGFCLLLAAIACFFLQTSTHAAIANPRWLRILVSLVLPFFLLLLLVRKFGFYPINIFLALFLSLSVVHMSVLFVAEDQAGPASSTAAYELKKRPSIYLFFLESYHSLDIQREVYGIDTSELETYLAQNDFVDYGKIYANSPATLTSFADTFGFVSSVVSTRGNNDALYNLRLMLGGDKKNTLFRILKQNDYKTVLLVGDTGYYGSVKGEFLDESDGMFSLPRKSALLCDALFYFSTLNTRLFGLLKYRANFLEPLRNESTTHYTGSREERVYQALATPMHPTSPLFLTFKGGAEHTPSDGSYSWQEHTNWVQSGFYQERVDDGNQELRRICDRIIAQDPGSIIILIGDHGAWRFRGIDAKPVIASIDDLIGLIKKENISFQDFVEDRHAVFLAIRLPHGQQENISYGMPLSHVNLFRHIFAYLNDDKTILETREPSNSYRHDHILVKEGAVVAK